MRRIARRRRRGTIETRLKIVKRGRRREGEKSGGSSWATSVFRVARVKSPVTECVGVGCRRQPAEGGMNGGGRTAGVKMSMRKRAADAGAAERERMSATASAEKRRRKARMLTSMLATPWVQECAPPSVVRIAGQLDVLRLLIAPLAWMVAEYAEHRTYCDHGTSSYAISGHRRNGHGNQVSSRLWWRGCMRA
jgi:hypothetical protein